MRDMEYILRFFALSSDEFKVGTPGRLSLRRHLDLFIKSNAKIPDEESGDLERRFYAAIDMAFLLFGENAFHNVSPSDTSRFVPKFNPTIFDSIMAAINSAIRRGISPIGDPVEQRLQLLRDVEYRSVISQETMHRSSIDKRFEKASSFLFGVGYE